MKKLPTVDQLDLLSRRQQVLYALKAAKLVAHLTTLLEAKEAVAVTERWLAGAATIGECQAAARVAYDAANAAFYAANAAYASTNAAYVAAYVADATYVAASYAADAAAYAAAYAVNAADAADAAAAGRSVRRKLLDYYHYLLTMGERVWKILEE